MGNICRQRNKVEETCQTARIIVIWSQLEAVSRIRQQKKGEGKGSYTEITPKTVSVNGENVLKFKPGPSQRHLLIGSRVVFRQSRAGLHVWANLVLLQPPV